MSARSTAAPVANVLLPIALLLAPLTAWSAPTTVDGKDAAREYNRTGITALKEGRDEDALEAFERAWELLPDPRIRLNMALAHENLRRLEEAREQYEGFLKQFPLHPSARGARKRSAELSEEMKRCGKVIIVVEPVADRVEFAGRAFRRQPVKAWMEPGTYPLRVEKAGHITAEQQVEVARGARFEVRVALLPVPAPVPTAVPPQPAPAQPAPAQPAPVAADTAPAPRAVEAPREVPAQTSARSDDAASTSPARPILRVVAAVAAAGVLPVLLVGVAGVAMLVLPYVAVSIPGPSDHVRQPLLVSVWTGAIIGAVSALLLPLPVVLGVALAVASFLAP